MSSARLQDLHDYVRDENLPLDSILVVRNGYIVYEDYPDPVTFDESTIHVLYSVTKSFTSALVGIAIQQGYIGGVHDSVISYFPNRTIANLDARKQAMTIEDLLNMMAGMEWDEWTYPYSDMHNSYLQMMYSADCVQFMLDRPMAAEPGTVWVYNSGATHLLAAVVQQATGQTPSQYANQVLLGPLGITDVYWAPDPQGLNYGGHALHLQPRDMAKFGFLYLNNGTWADQQVVPAAWVTQSQQSAVYPWGGTGYGYQWWKQLPFGTYEARGLNNQWIIVQPENRLVVVLTASDTEGRISPFYLFSNFILEAIEAFVPLDLSSLALPAALVLVLGVPIVVAGFYFLRKRHRS
jgi:CubicO group peptidase (beta-lactamase class C family)